MAEQEAERWEQEAEQEAEQEEETSSRHKGSSSNSMASGNISSGDVPSEVGGSHKSRSTSIIIIIGTGTSNRASVGTSRTQKRWKKGEASGGKNVCHPWAA